MATFRYLQPRQPGGKSPVQNAYQGDPNGVYLPGRENRRDARPRNVLYAPGTGPGTGRTGIRTGIVNRDGSTSPVSSMGYRTGPLSQPWPTSPPGTRKPGAGTSTLGAPAADAADHDAANRHSADDDTPENAAPYTSAPQQNRTLNPNAPLVYNPISLDNPGGDFVMQGATIADSSYMPEDNGSAAPQDSDNDPPRKRINAAPRNNIYMPGTGPGTGRTAIRIGTVNRDGSTSPVSSMGYATGPLSQSRPSSLPPKQTQTLETAASRPAAPPSTAATAGMEGTIKASTQQFGSQPGMPKPAPAPAAQSLTSNLDTLKTRTPKPPLGTPPLLDTKAPALSLTPSLGGIPTLKPSTGLDTLGGSSGKPFGSSTSLTGPLDLPGIKKRARGGPVRAGRPYLVGEEGPEIIVPKQSGTVVPNHALQVSPLGKAPTQFPSPAGGYIAEPTSDEDDDENDDGGQEARNPVYDASFDEPHDDAADSLPHEASFAERPADEAADTETSTETAPATRPTTGLMLRPRPMPPEYLQQQTRRGQPSSSRREEQAETPPDTSFLHKAEGQSGTPSHNRPPGTASQAPAYPGSRWLQKRPAPGTYTTPQPGTGLNAPSPQQRLQGSSQGIAAQQQQVREANPPAPGGKPAAQSQAISPYQGQAPDKMEEGRVTSSNNVSEVGETPALRPMRPGRSPDPGQPYSIERDKIEEEMKKLLLERRAVYDKLKNGNMPLSTDELTRLMELDYQRGLSANTDGVGMTFDELMTAADDAYFYHTEPDKKYHPGHEGFRGSGFALVESPKPQYDNPHIKRMARGHSDPYFGWEINYNVVGQWLRVAGYSKPEAMHFLAAWIAKSPSKWKSLNLDRQTWFWIGYDYAEARQKGWHPAGHAPEAKPANDGWVTPPPAPYPPARAPERSRHD